MPLYLALKKMGGGKTLITVILSLIYLKQHPDRVVYSNVEINHPRAIYKKYAFIPFSKLDNCMLIFDDMEDLTWLKGFQSVIANWSRKANLDIYCTGQDYTQFMPKLRGLCEYVISPSYSKASKNLFFQLFWINRNGDILKKRGSWYIYKASDFFDYYDTNQIVKRPYDYQIEKIILRESQNLEDLMDNVYMWKGKNKKKFEEAVEKLAKIKGFDTSKLHHGGKGIKTFNELELRGMDYRNVDIAEIKGIASSTASRRIQKREKEIYQILESEGKLI